MRRCECHVGYVGDGLQCLEELEPPVDRCLGESSPCHTDAVCTDLHFQGVLASPAPTTLHYLATVLLIIYPLSSCRKTGWCLPHPGHQWPLWSDLLRGQGSMRGPGSGPCFSPSTLCRPAGAQVSGVGAKPAEAH